MIITGSKIIRSIIFSAMILGLAASFSAQITINIPNIPKFPKKKDKAQPTTSSESDQRLDETATSSTSGSRKDNVCDKYYVFLRDIEKVRKEAESFTPGRLYFVSILSDRENKYFEAALIPSRRKEWFNGSAEMTTCVGPALDSLAEVARQKLPSYTGPPGYTLGTPAEKKVLLSVVTDLAQAKVISVGLGEANWLIGKDSYNFPTERYKHGVVILRYPNSESGFCRLFWINIRQDYAGGGTYGSSYGYYAGRSLAGCPAGK